MESELLKKDTNTNAVIHHYGGCRSLFSVAVVFPPFCLSPPIVYLCIFFMALTLI